MQNSATKNRILEQLQQLDRVVALDEIASEFDQTDQQLRSFMSELVKTGQVQQIGKSHYRFTGAPIPAEGESFTGKVTGTSYKGGVILRDSTGSSWRVEPV